MAWQQMFDALALHSKMTESEVKIMKDMRMIMTAEDAYELVAKVMAVLLQVLRDDPKKLKEAQFALTRLTGETGRWPGRGSHESGIDSGPGELDREELLYSRNEGRSYIERSHSTGGLPEGPPSG